ncbi:DUF4349 domain-containing protein [Oceanobacillus massiliensis]|uniref:DUF4349 domain-containing protein n=1 Tax=Oceanobacillus massiliensis TaxID=1465765 RepID=UPI0002892357|nr:DUF4349 domain-containing protein [Oceanobacillus massiliensis]
MGKRLYVIIIILFAGMVLTACSNESDSSQSTSNEAAFETTEESAGSVEQESGDSMHKDAIGEETAESGDEAIPSETEEEVIQSERKIIYTANLSIEVKDFQQALDDIQRQAADRGGYIVDSNMMEDTANDTTYGHVTLRIPQDQYREFIQFVEDGSSTVLESSESGQDVTEEYIDLESRLKSKHVVEERLLSFMEQAEKTEDLLAISNDLATVQGEIEEITGRMNYLENRTDLATVSISIQENNVSLSGMNDGELNTWEKRKNSF